MNLDQIVEQLEAERDRISRAIAALNGAAPQPAEARSYTRLPGRKGRRRQMSAAAKARISAAMKKRWAERKKNNHK